MSRDSSKTDEDLERPRDRVLRSRLTIAPVDTREICDARNASSRHLSFSFSFSLLTATSTPRPPPTTVTTSSTTAATTTTLLHYLTTYTTLHYTTIILLSLSLFFFPTLALSVSFALSFSSYSSSSLDGIRGSSVIAYGTVSAINVNTTRSM